MNERDVGQICDRCANKINLRRILRGEERHGECDVCHKIHNVSDIYYFERPKKKIKLTIKKLYV